jgi:NAD(P)-dependent dehydrogenase (short-subunit alcohol dehydrogenase family)
MPKIVFVTGGSRGIGAATARLAAERGYTVCMIYIEPVLVVDPPSGSHHFPWHAHR